MKNCVEWFAVECFSLSLCLLLACLSSKSEQCVLSHYLILPCDGIRYIYSYVCLCSSTPFFVISFSFIFDSLLLCLSPMDYELSLNDVFNGIVKTHRAYGIRQMYEPSETGGNYLCCEMRKWIVNLGNPQRFCHTFICALSSIPAIHTHILPESIARVAHNMSMSPECNPFYYYYHRHHHQVKCG